MDINGSQLIEAARQEVWNALLDPAVLKACLPGCESVERTSDREFLVVVAMAIGPLRARFKGRLSITEQQPPHSCVMVFQGEGGAVGFGKGSSSVELTEEGQATRLDYRAEAQVGGKLAQVGSRLIENVARKISDDFFRSFKAQLAGPSADASSVVEPVLAGVGVSAVADGPKRVGSTSKNPAAPVAVAAALTSPSGGRERVMVPGWWLAISACIGALATLSGMLVAR